MSDQETTALLTRFMAAWNAHDVDVLVACMTPDGGAFYASSGPGRVGTAAVGTEAVRKAYAAIFETFPDAQWTNGRHFVAGEDACSYWTFVGTRKDGTKVEVNGCDLFKIRDGKIAVKDSYRKQIV